MEKVFNTYDYRYEQEKCQNAVNNLFCGYSKLYSSEKRIPFFQKQTLYRVIEKDDCNQKWMSKFKNMEKAKNAFLGLRVTKKLKKEINNRTNVV